MASQENIAGLKTQLELQGKIQDLTKQEWWNYFSYGALAVIVGELIIATVIILLQ